MILSAYFDKCNKGLSVFRAANVNNEKLVKVPDGSVKVHVYASKCVTVGRRYMR